MLQQTEDSEFTRRRGRWINQKVMEIYIQATSAFQFLAAMPANVRGKVFDLCHLFPFALKFAKKNWQACIPLHAWYIFWKRQVV